ncbi:MAG: LD-carboxypeptidase [Bacteroidota bacterium]|nr:LD-carboxypeptidase [Bacteroidota bacterium]
MKPENSNITINPLQKGNKVAIAATARKVSEAEMADAVTLLKSWGLEVVYAQGLFEQENQFAGSDAHRVHSFQLVMDDPEIKAIFCARGGYGTVRMIDALDFTGLLKSPKWIVGFSDVTVIQCHLLKNFSYPTLHGPMAFNFTKEKADAESIESLRKTLFGEPYSMVFARHELNQKEQNISGILCGGNLSVLYSVLGSVSDMDTSDKILFIEDLDEYLYHIDRMMQAMKRAGKLNKLKALIVGDMGDMKDNAIPFGKTAYEIIADTVKDYDYPVIFGAPCGHERRNLSLVFGVEYEMKVDDKNVLLSLLNNPSASYQ